MISPGMDLPLLPLALIHLATSRGCELRSVNDITLGVTYPLGKHPCFPLDIDIDRGYRDPTAVDGGIYFDVTLRFPFGAQAYNSFGVGNASSF